MVKIGLLTLNGYSNFGNRLQNYATQEVLNSLGFDVETIINATVSEKTLSKRLNNLKKYSSRDICSKIYDKLLRSLKKRSIAKS